MTFRRQVVERLEAVLSGEQQPEELTGATSVRAAVGLVLGRLEGITTLSEKQAWDYLDDGNVRLVRGLRNDFADRVQQYNRRRKELA